MRRDVYIENDSGGFSVTSGASVDAVISAGGGLDGLAAAREALLVELSGDDSMPVRLVVNEPLQPEEEAQWLARASAHLHTDDGRLVVMGGFDPDVMTWWRVETGGTRDGRGVAFVQTSPGTVRVDVYAHVGSMNGRRVLSESGTPPGAAFRRDHDGQPFPVWLAHMLDYSGEDDPGHEGLWRDVRASIAGAALEVEEEPQSVIGFLVHITPAPAGQQADASADDWIAWDANSRIPASFPLGLPAEVADPGLVAWARRAFGEPEPEAAPRAVQEIFSVVDQWPGPGLAPLADGAVSLPLTDLHALYWIAALGSDSPPLFEIRVTPRGTWAAPAACPEFGVAEGSGYVSLGVPGTWGGWAAFWSARRAAEALTGVPDGSIVELATMPQPRHMDDNERNPAVGLVRFRGAVNAGLWEIAEATPVVPAAVLADAVAFARELVGPRRLPVRGDEERDALAEAAASYAPDADELVWEGDTVRHFDRDDERTLLLLAGPVFRTRFADAWPFDEEEE